MTALLTLILPVVLAWPAVEVPKHSCLWGPFHGITETDAIGAHTGSVDRQDWGCVVPAAGGTGVKITADVPVPPPPDGVCLREAYPNPATTQTRVSFTLSESQPVTLVVYARETGHGPPRVLEVNRLVDGTLAAGTHEVFWNLTDTDGARVPAGVYRVVLEAGEATLCGDVEIR